MNAKPEQNNIMRLLGFQYYANIVTDEDIQNIHKITAANLAKKNNTFLSMMVDVFVYGYICGKRAERKKHKTVA